MKPFVVGAFAVAATAFAAPVSAQTYAPYSSTTYSGPITPEMIDNGSSSDFPTYEPSDISGEALNHQGLMQNETVTPAPYYAPVR